ncbi:hypothetical protein LCGC14_0455030 [marine sediment metagenome]|uniref:Uncharacterized protein n=1 Tax=marine sediment metagenome TaxID=412755 RepID=A0A0F9SLV3_9ZZZZ
MGIAEMFDSQQVDPPVKLKVYAPNGDTKEVVGYVRIRGLECNLHVSELLLLHDNGTVEMLNKKVVIQNLETGQVYYSPRTAPCYVGDWAFITDSERRWLNENPHWPAVLELKDNPVDNGEERIGINP